MCHLSFGVLAQSIVLGLDIFAIINCPICCFTIKLKNAWILLIIKETVSLTAAQFIVGIDLGTTHCCLAYAPISAPTDVQLLPLLQRVGPGQMAERPLLPSIRYHPSDEELAVDDAALPWSSTLLDGEPQGAWFGTYPYWLGGKQLGRLVTSAKSWLSHPRADRTAAILPWSESVGQSKNVDTAKTDTKTDTKGGAPKVSPIIASASYLCYLRDAWNHQFPDAPMTQQHVVVTLPASFDDMARVMTRQACRLAGLNEVHLLEEPTAACYDWYRRVQQGQQEPPENLSQILVCDVGGGTTDFSLLSVTAVAPDLQVQRTAVGDHLMLGGDNIDLALAGLVQQQLGSDVRKLSLSQLSQLMVQTRQAKESLLAQSGPEEVSVTVLGQGGGLLAGAKKGVLSREAVQQLVLDGYFPEVEYETPLQQGGSAVVAFGLPYARDPAISRHLVAFLRKHQQAGIPPVPDAVMFNGGLFKSDLLRERLVAQLSAWRGSPVRVLENPAPEYAVARGAVAYGAALLGETHKIKATLPRHYFLLAAGLDGQGICLLPKGSETAQIHPLGQQFALRVGEPVQMHVVASTLPRHFAVGELVDLVDIEPVPLPPLQVVIDPPEDSAERVLEVPVRLSASATDIGTLELQCQPVMDSQTNALWPADQQWRFEFDGVLNSTDSPDSGSCGDHNHLPTPHANTAQALAAVEAVFGKADAQAAKAHPPGKLRAQLEKTLGARDSWNISTLRAMADKLLSLSKRRRRSAAHERVWFWLMGYCMRPGYGVVGDTDRMAQLWNLFDAGLQYDTESQNQSHWWLLWRRVCGGLVLTEQQILAERVLELLQRLSSGKRQKLKGKGAALLKAQAAGQGDAVRLLGMLELLPLAQRTNIGEQLLKQLKQDINNESLWWSLGRVGARQLLSADRQLPIALQPLPPATVARWLPVLIEILKGKKTFPIEAAAFSVMQISQRTNDAIFNLEPALAQSVAAALSALKVPERWVQAIESVCDQDDADQKMRLGEQMPHGLRLMKA